MKEFIIIIVKEFIFYVIVCDFLSDSSFVFVIVNLNNNFFIWDEFCKFI